MSLPGFDNVRIAWPPLTRGLKALLIVYASIFIATLFKGSLGFESFLTDKLYLSWDGLIGGLYLWQPLTYQLLHADFFHALLNCLVLYGFGGELERRWSAKHFVFFVILCGVGGAAAVVLDNLLSLWLLGSPGGPVVGASGGISGVLAAYCLINWEKPISLMFIPGSFRAKWLFWFFLGLNLMMWIVSFAAPQVGPAISYSAHIGGLLVGALIVSGYYKPDRLLDRLRLWRARRRLRLLRGGHPLENKNPDKPGRYLH